MDFQEVLMFELSGNYSKLDLNKIESVEALRLFDDYDDPVHIRWPNFIEDMKDISKIFSGREFKITVSSFELSDEEEFFTFINGKLK
jgi:hypothetical protein|nr:MAG TPA: hypothetical protein [Caudoviricetes sp.]